MTKMTLNIPINVRIDQETPEMELKRKKEKLSLEFIDAFILAICPNLRGLTYLSSSISSVYYNSL